MVKILILDVYPKKKYRISKDQNGGFGTANDYGNNFFLKLLSLYVKNNVDYPPLSCVYVAGQLRANGFDVDYARSLDKSKNYDLYILPSSIVCHETEINFTKELTSQNKKVFIIGPFASSKPEAYNNNGGKVILNEPEMFFYDFMPADLDKFNGFEKLIRAEKQISLDDLHLPAWDIISKNIKPVMSFLGRGTTIPINASRGCPYTCFYYCTYPLQQGRKLRLRSPENIVNEMLHWNLTLKTKNFIFRDPVFSIDKKHTIKLLKKISQCGIKFNICIETHLKNIDSEMIKNFKIAGVKIIYVGIESSDDDVLLDAHRTTIKPDLQLERINEIEKNNIKVKCMYIIGLPADTIKTCKNTIDYSKKLLSSYAQYSVFTPYPGTPAFKDYEDKLISKKFEDFNQWQLVFKHPELTPKNVRYLLKKAYLTYYLNPLWIIKFIISKFKPSSLT